jgi:CHAD domain-containing protein
MSTSPVTHVFDLPEGVRSKKIIAEISNAFPTLTPPVRRLRLRYYDTFDWRLYGRGMLLVRVNEEFRLRRAEDDATIASCRVTGEPAFWWDFPAGRLQDNLRQMSEERALLAVGDVGLRIRDIRVLNADDKTVVRARVEEGEAFDRGTETAPVRVVNVLPVRGYRKDARRLAEFLTASGFRPAARNTFEVAVEMQGRRPGDYTSKLSLPLVKSMTAQEAAGVIFGRLLDTIERNEQGIRQDIDTEFLHDFRVAIRRTRAGLSQIKNVLPADTTKSYLARFAELGRSTNRLRDLDVYLLRQKHYTEMLAEDLRPALVPLFEALAEERGEALAVAVRMLASQKYRILVREWRATLVSFGSSELDAKNATVPVDKLSRRFIKKQHARVLAIGGRIDDGTPDSELHALRIQCKKLRYLLEFFSSLYPQEEVAVFVKQLKRLQDNLGDFNDLSVQQTELKSFLQRRPQRVSVDTAAAIGALIARLEDRHKSVRNSFAATFEAFAGQANADRFHRLFGGR